MAIALATVPAGSTSVEFSDEAAKLRQWNITRPVRASDTEMLRRWIQQDQLIPTAVSDWVPAMTQVMLQDGWGWGWSWLDVDWSVSVTADGPPHSVIKLRDDLDMSVVTASLKRHYTESGPADQPAFSLNLDKGIDSVPFVAPVTVLPGQHLMILGASPASFLATIHGTSASMSTDPTVLALTSRIGLAEYLMLRTGVHACSHQLQTSAETTSEPGAEKVIAPVALALADADDTHSKVITRYADADDARADRPRRSTLLAKGQSPTTRESFGKLLGPVTISQSGPDLTYDFTAPAAPRLIDQMQRGDDPWAWC